MVVPWFVDDVGVGRSDQVTIIRELILQMTSTWSLPLLVLTQWHSDAFITLKEFPFSSNGVASIFGYNRARSRSCRWCLCDAISEM